MRHFPLYLALLLAISCTSTPKDEVPPPPAPYAGLECSHWRDGNGVSHVKAESEAAAFGCLGFLHARDRAFQMDFLRRTLQGRLSEVLGGAKVSEDFFMRLLALEERGRKVFDEMSSKARELLGAYSHGVNVGFRAALKAGVHEFSKLGYTPEPWRPDLSVSLLLLQSFSETKVSFTHEFTEEKWKKAWGERTMELVAAEGVPWDVSILKAGEAPVMAGGNRARMLPGAEETKGSNSWVLARDRSRTGNAWFANDPHVSLQYPSFWYWVHLQGGDLDVTGASVPGLPLIPSGFNRHLAWGLTDSQMNTADAVVVPEDEVGDFESSRPTVWFRFGFFRLPFFLKSYQTSAIGYPVLPVDAPPGKAVVLRWSGFLVDGKSLSGFHQMMSAKSVDEMDGVLRELSIPSFNFVFADTKGNIGYRVLGPVPRESSPTPLGHGIRSFPEARAWTMLAPEQIPHLKNPRRGFIVTANNRPWAPGEGFYSGRSFAHGFRAFRIEEQLGKSRKHDLKSQRQIQCDTQMVDARFVARQLVAFVERATDKKEWDSRLQAALKLIKGWDFNGGPECRACGVYARWVDRLLEHAQINISGAYRLLQTDKSEEFRKTVFRALEDALNDLRSESDEDFPAWSRLHRGYFAHLSKDADFSSEDWIPTPGGPHSVNVGGGTWKDGYYSHTSGAAHRLIVELSDPPQAHFAWDGGPQSLEKHSLSRARSTWIAWRDCEYKKAVFPVDWKKVEKAETIALSVP